MRRFFFSSRNELARSTKFGGEIALVESMDSGEVFAIEFAPEEPLTDRAIPIGRCAVLRPQPITRSKGASG